MPSALPPLLTNILLLVLLLATPTLSLGINCKGSSLCKLTSGSLQDLLYQTWSLPADKVFRPGEHIVCDGNKGIIMGLCLFTQHTKSNIDVPTIQTLLQSLSGNGCQKCGSIPLTASGDGKDGELTINYVSHRKRGVLGERGAAWDDEEKREVVEELEEPEEEWVESTL